MALSWRCKAHRQPSRVDGPTQANRRKYSRLLNSNNNNIIIIIIATIILALNRWKFRRRTNYSMADCVLASLLRHLSTPPKIPNQWPTNNNNSNSGHNSKLPYVFFFQRSFFFVGSCTSFGLRFDLHIYCYCNFCDFKCVHTIAAHEQRKQFSAKLGTRVCSARTYGCQIIECADASNNLI